MLVIPVTVDAGPEPTYEEKMRVPPTLGGSVAECRTRDGWVAGSSLTGATVLWS